MECPKKTPLVEIGEPNWVPILLFISPILLLSAYYFHNERKCLEVMTRHVYWPFLHMFTTSVYSVLYEENGSLLEGIMLNIISVSTSFVITTNWKTVIQTVSTYCQQEKAETVPIEPASTSMDHEEINQPSEEPDIMAMIPDEILDGIFAPHECRTASTSTN